MRALRKEIIITLRQIFRRRELLRRIVCWIILVLLYVNIFAAVQVYRVSAEPNIDLFTQKGGRGQAVPSPPFASEEEVILCANVTYGGWPEMNKDVVFQLFDPNGGTFILVDRTNTSGIATAKLAFPSSPEPTETFGTWRVLASVNIAGAPAVDTLLFDVRWILADINNDLVVDLYDVVLVCSAYKATPSNPKWNVQCDIAEPYGIININDVVKVAVNYELAWG